ncbi:MAG: type II toxin-antitoxin system HicB family antitoxin [Oscillospiraceae bacterium]|jgi:predicted RNase H-like HicB family nuclease|nr:type II toxin-antitoxin system HicB family antitoxin [Oscillospiraceae bacterium]
MIYVYPIKYTIEEGAHYVGEAPDLSGCVFGADSMANLLREGSDAMGTWIDDALNCGEELPNPSEVESLRRTPHEYTSHIMVDLDEFRRRFRSKAVRKTLSIPEWMSKQAELMGLSLSQILQDALSARFQGS